jgi:tRNA-binding protein
MPAPVKPMVSLDVVHQVDIRVGTIESVSDIAGSDKLVALRVAFGDHTRTIVAGMKQERTNPREIEGKQALFIVNLNRRRHYCGNPPDAIFTRSVMAPTVCP